MDDIIIHSRTKREHDARLCGVLSVLREREDSRGTKINVKLKIRDYLFEPPYLA